MAMMNFLSGFFVKRFLQRSSRRGAETQRTQRDFSNQKAKLIHHDNKKELGGLRAALNLFAPLFLLLSPRLCAFAPLRDRIQVKASEKFQ